MLIDEYLKEHYQSIELDEFNNLVLDGEVYEGTPKTNPDLLVITATIRKELEMEKTSDWEVFKAIKARARKSGRSKNFSGGNEPEWYDKLIRDEKGKITPCQRNFETFLLESKEYKGKIYYDSFRKMVIVEGKSDRMDQETLLSVISSDCEKELGINSIRLMKQAFLSVSIQKSANPVIRELEKLKWDGEKRMENILIRVCGAPDTDLTRKVTRNFFFSMIKRLYIPGAPFAAMPVLIQDLQKTGKSLWIEYLLKPLEEKVGFALFQNFKDTNEKDIVHNLKNLWVVQFDESHALFQKNIEWIKTFITETRDVIRLSYMREAQCYERHCVFVANSNKQSILQDYSGKPEDLQRRFMILLCNGHPRTNEEWSQVWDEYYKLQVLAEALYMYKKNPNYDYISYTEEETLEEVEIQKQCKTVNETEEVIMDCLEEMLNSRIYLKPVVKRELEDRESWMIKAKQYNELQSSDQLHYLQEVPTVYIREWINDKVAINNITSQKLTHIMDQLGWGREKRNRKPGGIYDCFFRKEKI